MWVKLCGQTRVEDCLLAAELGADAVGFVFVPGGPRTVVTEQVAAITRQLPPALEKIGVFATRNAEEIAAVVTAAGLSGVQLHGPLDMGLPGRLREFLPAGTLSRVIQVVSWWVGVPDEAQREVFALECDAIAEEGAVDALLVDSRTTAKRGGTGLTFPWHATREILRAARLPVIVAGGLTPENVPSAVEALQPFGVDVASGVEDRPGVKNAERMRGFLSNARA